MFKNKGAVRFLNRNRKALTIEALLNDFTGQSIESMKVLDIGCGNGQISDHFSTLNECYAVDISDQRPDGLSSFIFTEISDEKLPFNEDFFDIIISHHVIEHVESQALHLSEISRVLKPSGFAYIACPNKRSPFMKGHIGNQMVLRPDELKRLLLKANFIIREYYTDFLSDPEKYFCDLSLGKYFPKWFIRLFLQWYPSQCYMLQKK